MRFETKYDIDADVFKTRTDYILICFECKSDEIIAHYIKNGKNYTVAAPTLSDIIRLWNEEII